MSGDAELQARIDAAIEAVAAEPIDAVFSAYRWSCPNCGRFIPAEAVTSEPFRDDSAYYGVSDRTTGTCSRCGEVQEPNFAPTRIVVPDGAQANHHAGEPAA